MNGHVPVVKSESEIVNLSLVLRPCAKGQKGHNNLKEVSHLDPKNSKRHDADNQEMKTLVHGTTFWLGASNGVSLIKTESQLPMECSESQIFVTVLLLV